MPAPDSTAVTASPPPSPPPPPRRRRRLLWVGLAFLGLFLATPFVAYFALSWLSGRELEQAIAEADRLDPRWRFDDIQADRRPVPEERNSARIVAKVNGLLGPPGFDLGGQKNYELFDGLPPPALLNFQQEAVLREALAKHPQALEEARKLKDFPEGRYAIQYNRNLFGMNLEPIHRARTVMSLLQHDAMLRSHDEDDRGAAESCRACLNAARSVDEPFLIAALVRIAGQALTTQALERALAQGQPPEGELQALQELLEKEAAEPILVNALRGERAASFDTVQELKAGRIDHKGLTGVPGGNTLLDRLVGAFPMILMRGEGKLLRILTRSVEAAKLPPEQAAPAMHRIEIENFDARAPLVHLLLPAVRRMGEVSQRSQAYLRTAQVGVAAERYRMKHDRWPTSLDALVQAGLLREAPTDPYDGQPLRWRRVPGGAVVYSVGPDLTDNQGQINHDNLDPGTDVGLRLFDVDARRQPPLPIRPQRNDDLDN